MQYHRTELSWACFVSLCLVFSGFGLSSWFVSLELCSLLRQPFFSLLGLPGCSLCCLIPALLLNFSASWVLAFSHLPKQPQRLYQDNYGFHQLFIELVSFACHSQFSKAPSLWWLTFPHAVCEMFLLPAVPVRLLWRGWTRHSASCTLLLGQAGTTKSYCASTDLGLSSETSSALVNLWGKNVRSFLLLCWKRQ